MIPYNSPTLVSFIGPSTDLLFTILVDQPPPYSPPRGSLANFIGEDPLPTPPVPDQPSRRPPDSHVFPSPTAGLASSPPGPSTWSNEQRHQFLQALLGSAPPNQPNPIGASMAAGTPGAEPEDPLLALMSSLGVGEGVFQDRGGVFQSKTEEKPKTFIQRSLPLLHLIAVWALVAFFIFWREPESFRARHSAVVSSGDVWNRWARLANGPADLSSWSIETEVSLSLVVAAQ
jgi:GET complex subunit GET2